MVLKPRRTSTSSPVQDAVRTGFSKKRRDVLSVLEVPPPDRGWPTTRPRTLFNFVLTLFVFKIIGSTVGLFFFGDATNFDWQFYGDVEHVLQRSNSTWRVLILGRVQIDLQKLLR
eukprot:Pompholyxophrys_punicea_v1_NODE_741_length_1371_cov_3.424772.p1 type:complete len:115 gc:universal NODE_741_length_1371_cov_3.424772:884-540(-)